MKALFTITLLFCCHTVFAIISPAKNSQNFLKYLNTQVGSKAFSLQDLPKNVGGKGPQYPLNKGAKLAEKIQDIAISDETVFQGVIKDVFEPLEDMILAKKINVSLIATSQADFNFDFKTTLTQEAKNDFTHVLWGPAAKTMPGKKFDTVFADYLNEFKTIEFVDISPFSIKTPLSSRDLESYQPKSFETSVRIDIRGVDHKNFRRNDRFTVTVESSRDAATKHWKLLGFKLNTGETLTASRASFTEVKTIAKAAPANYLRREAIRRGGYALSVADWSGDGQPDLIVGHMGAIEFFKGTGKGDFEKVSNESLGVENITLVKSAVCADFDNDGTKDLLLVRFAPHDANTKTEDIVLYHGKANKFIKSTSIMNRLVNNQAMPSAVADFNNDGLLDFYIGFPGVKDFTVLNKNEGSLVNQSAKTPQGLFYNIGNFQFEDVTHDKLLSAKTTRAQASIEPTAETSYIFPHTSSAIDYDLDGNMDIVIVDDKANLSPLYKNNGLGKFEQVADKIGVTNYDFGMGFTAADLDNDGSLEFIYTNVNFLPAERLHHAKMNNFSEHSNLPGNAGLRIFKTKNGKTYSDITELSGITHPGYGVGGVEIIDFNNDGYPDIYVSNGLWSGNTKKQDVSSLFARAYSKFDLDYEESLGVNAVGVAQANTSFMKVLTDFKGDIQNTKKDNSLRPSMSGFQRNRLYLNNKDATFTEVGYLAGVDSMADGYISATADLNNDGKLDLVLRNADPGVEENRFPSIQVFLNESVSPNKSVVLSFQGQKSNSGGVGIVVEAIINNKKLIRHLVANNGASQAQPLLHFGLAENTKIDKLTLKWPSGTVDVYKNVPAGHHNYKESKGNITSARL